MNQTTSTKALSFDLCAIHLWLAMQQVTNFLFFLSMFYPCRPTLNPKSCSCLEMPPYTNNIYYILCHNLIYVDVPWGWGMGRAQSPWGLYGWGSVADQTHPRPKCRASTGVGPTWGHSCQVCLRLLYCCCGNNLRLDIHGWHSVSNHWLHTKGRVPKTCVGRFGNPTMGLVVQGWGVNHVHVWHALG